MIGKRLKNEDFCRHLDDTHIEGHVVSKKIMIGPVNINFYLEEPAKLSTSIVYIKMTPSRHGDYTDTNLPMLAKPANAILTHSEVISRLFAEWSSKKNHNNTGPLCLGWEVIWNDFERGLKSFSMDLKHHPIIINLPLRLIEACFTDLVWKFYFKLIPGSSRMSRRNTKYWDHLDASLLFADEQRHRGAFSDHHLTHCYGIALILSQFTQNILNVGYFASIGICHIMHNFLEYFCHLCKKIFTTKSSRYQPNLVLNDEMMIMDRLLHYSSAVLGSQNAAHATYHQWWIETSDILRQIASDIWDHYLSRYRSLHKSAPLHSMVSDDSRQIYEDLRIQHNIFSETLALDGEDALFMLIRIAVMSNALGSWNLYSMMLSLIAFTNPSANWTKQSLPDYVLYSTFILSQSKALQYRFIELSGICAAVKSIYSIKDIQKVNKAKSSSFSTSNTGNGPQEHELARHLASGPRMHCGSKMNTLPFNGLTHHASLVRRTLHYPNYNGYPMDESHNPPVKTSIGAAAHETVEAGQFSRKMHQKAALEHKKSMVANLDFSDQGCAQLKAAHRHAASMTASMYRNRSRDSRPSVVTKKSSSNRRVKNAFVADAAYELSESPVPQNSSYSTLLVKSHCENNAPGPYAYGHLAETHNPAQKARLAKQSAAEPFERSSVRKAQHSYAQPGLSRYLYSPAVYGERSFQRQLTSSVSIQPSSAAGIAKSKDDHHPPSPRAEEGCAKADASVAPPLERSPANSPQDFAPSKGGALTAFWRREKSSEDESVDKQIDRPQPRHIFDDAENSERGARQSGKEGASHLDDSHSQYLSGQHFNGDLRSFLRDSEGNSPHICSHSVKSQKSTSGASAQNSSSRPSPAFKKVFQYKGPSEFERRSEDDAQHLIESLGLSRPSAALPDQKCEPKFLQATPGASPTQRRSLHMKKSDDLMTTTTTASNGPEVVRVTAAGWAKASRESAMAASDLSSRTTPEANKERPKRTDGLDELIRPAPDGAVASKRAFASAAAGHTAASKLDSYSAGDAHCSKGPWQPAKVTAIPPATQITIGAEMGANIEQYLEDSSFL